MVPQEITQQLRDEAHRLKEAQEMFLKTYRQLCIHLGKDEWTKRQFEMVFHLVRKEILPLMEQAGIDAASVQALCASTEHVLVRS